MQFELSIEAEKDLEDIFDYTYEEFGPVQAFEYVRSFDECFKSITENSRIGIERLEIREGLRSIIWGSHIIFYRILNSKIRIIRILHGSRDLPRFFNK